VTGLRRQSTYLIVLVAGPIVPIALSFAGLLVARSLSPTVYGRVAYFFSAFNLITILWQLGLGPLATGEVARSTRAGGIRAAAQVTPPYLIARLVSLALLIPVGIGAALLGDPIVASASAAAGIALLAIFAQALTQGLGYAGLVGSVQIAQALLYLIVIVIWAKDAPERVFLAVGATYALSLIAMAWASRSVVPNITRWWTLSRGRWRSTTQAVGWLYAIALLQTPYSSLAVIGLGNLGRFEDAGSFSIALTIPTLMAVSAATIISIQYYPELCHVLPDSPLDARQHFDRLYRLLAWVGITAAAVLASQPATVIAVLFTAAYATAVAPLAALSLAALILPMVQLALWTLIAHRVWRWAVAVAAMELVGVIPFIGVALVLPQTPLWVLAAGHTFGAVAGLVIGVAGLWRLRAGYDWRPWRVGLASVTAVLVALGACAIVGTYGILSVAIATAVVLGCAGLVIWSPEIVSVSAPWRATRSSRRSDARSADVGLE
jgi:O-antigen/teichoic acid export membrane protein